MAFRFRSRATIGGSSENQISKLTNAQLNQLTKLYPPWLKDNTALKQLPGIYQGVLGQVQLQPGIDDIDKKLLGRQEKPTDYMNKFTDTERVHQLLSASQLPDETLATIWAHVNKTFPGKLTNREVCLALSLIATFQKLEKEASFGVSHFSPSSKHKDPFNLVKLDKKPPVPILYSYWTKDSSNNSGNCCPIKGIVQSKSTPENLNSSAKCLLVDIVSGNDEESPKKISDQTLHDECRDTNSDLNPKIRDIVLANPMSLIDMDLDRFELDFNRTSKMWFQFLSSMKSIYKRSFDILNVENSRLSAIEALKSPRGMDFGINLSLCYPLAHNIKQKIDHLTSSILVTDEQSGITLGIFDKKYALKIDDLMTSINEYWAVLINLLHESGQTEFIELIMDGLIVSKGLTSSISIDDIAMEFAPRSDMCSICHNRFYLDPHHDLSSIKKQPGRVLDLVANEELVSDNNQHYYHPRCASFWLNQVDATSLPFPSVQLDQRILSPALLD